MPAMHAPRDLVLMPPPGAEVLGWIRIPVDLSGEVWEFHTPAPRRSWAETIELAAAVVLACVAAAVMVGLCGPVLMGTGFA
jgi:hypothetical protein